MSLASFAHVAQRGMQRLLAGAASLALAAALIVAGSAAPAGAGSHDGSGGPPEGVPGPSDEQQDGGPSDDGDSPHDGDSPDDGDSSDDGDSPDDGGPPDDGESAGDGGPADDGGPPDDAGPPFGPPVEGDPEGITRISGVTRYDTSVSLSQYTHPEGAQEVFVATGGGFADSLAGAPAAAAADAPVLFSPPGTLVNGVASELLRLDPESVTVLGGPAVVAPRIVEQIEGLLSGDSGDGVTVERHAGDDRFGTAAAISEATHPDGADDVYLATGGRYPDGLAGAPIAASLNAPVLLSTSGSLPQATSAELQRLDPNTVTVMGGPGAVNDAVLDEVEELTGAAVQRIAGSSRFGTAVAASQFLSGQQESVTAESSTVYVATGLGWADALAGAAAAGADGAPVLLTTPGRLPDMVADELRRLAPDEVVVLGGPGAVTSRVAHQVADALDGSGGGAP